MSIRKDVSRALHILTKYRSQLNDYGDKSFRNAIEKMVDTLESTLFSSLLDILECNELTITGDNAKFSSEIMIDRSKGFGLTNSNSIPDHSSSSKMFNSDKIDSAQGDWEYLDIVLRRDPSSPGGFGFSITGGIDNPISNADKGIFVTRITPNGCADKDSRLRVDDQILTVNDINIEHVTNSEAVNTLRNTGNQLNLVVRRYVGAFIVENQSNETPQQRDYKHKAESDLEESGQTPVWYEVELHKPHTSVGLGFSIAGGHDMQEQNLPGTGIFVTRIIPGGLADKEGHMFPGDQLMQVNGIDLTQATHAEAVDILRNAGITVHLVLIRQSGFEYAEDLESVIQARNSSTHSHRAR